jgi:glutathione S-transferase
MMITLYNHLDSGNGYKIRLLLAQLEEPYRYVEVDILRGASRTPEFLAKNLNGRIPIIELEDGRFLAESDAILCYLAEGTDFLPTDRYARAQVLQWMFFEQYSHEPYVATPRFIVRHLPADSPRQAELPQRLAQGGKALTVMESHLTGRSYFVSDCYSVADIALYAYTHVAEDGGLSLASFPQVRAWLARVAAQPLHVRIHDQPTQRL